MKLWIVFSFISLTLSENLKYKPSWKSLDARPLPKWFDESKIGIFIHFGVYSVPSFTSEWFWCYWKCPDRIHDSVVSFMKKNYPPGFTYQDFAREFSLEFFDAEEWVKIFEQSGAKYAVLTSKHHEGFTLYPSKHSFSWNSVDVGPNRDIVGEFAKAVRKSSLRLGIYHSLFEWFNPLYLEDKANNFTTRVYPVTKGTAELYELVEKYEPDLIWSDGDAGPVDYWKSKEFLAWLYNESPVKDNVVVNDRWGSGTSCKHGGYLNCADRVIRFNPSSKQTRKWENAMTLDKHSWGYRRNAKLQDYYTIQELLRVMFQTLSNGGNLLIDVGPTKEGTIPLIMQERLKQMGQFLNYNGEAVYETARWDKARKDNVTSDVYYTENKLTGTYYALFINYPFDRVLGEAEATKATRIELVGLPDNWLKWERTSYGIKIQLPDLATIQHLQYGWALKFRQIQVNIHRLE